MNAPALALAPDTTAGTRTTSDRLELLQTLIAGPAFDPVLRGDVIRVPHDHPVYGWLCGVPKCERSRDVWRDYCCDHAAQWNRFQREGRDIVAFLKEAVPLKPRGGRHLGTCLFCPDVPAYSGNGLCYLHSGALVKWRAFQRRSGRPDDYELWAARQEPFPRFGDCRAPSCPEGAGHYIGLCPYHFLRYIREGRPGNARAVHQRARRGEPAVFTVTYADEAAFRRWCAEATPAGRTDGVLSLRGLRPLARAEFKWVLHRHAQGPAEGARWPISVVQRLVTECQRQQISSLADLDLDGPPQHPRTMARAMLNHLRLVYFSRQDTKEAGYFETDHYGIRLSGHLSYFDLTMISQRWLRDMLWDWMDMRLTTDPPRGKTAFTRPRRGCVELSAYLEAHAPEGGHDPTLLRKEHMVGFVADQRHRAEHGLKPLGVHHKVLQCGRGPADVTKVHVAGVFSATRHVLRAAMDAGETERIGLERQFVVALPSGGNVRGKRRRPFSDEAARALADDANLTRLDSTDIDDRGLRDIWETIVVTGRRASEVLTLRLDCIGRYKGLPLLWHDQTKVGQLDEAIRISERIHQRIEARQSRTRARFAQRHGRPPTPAEELELALFPRRTSNRTGVKSVSYGWFHTLFHAWVLTLDIPHTVAHQARHTLATNLLKAGANLSQIKRYLGQVSDAMAEHYAHIANTDPRLSDALQTVWVSGPGALEPGIVLSGGEPMSRQEAEAMLVDLTHRSTPAEGGFCTFQPVVDGGACPWNLDCHNCDKFVMTGADLVYWHRKREHWRTLAEGASDPATRDYLHKYFDPTARAIDGLERALAAVGLLEEALSLDLRRPQDFYGRVWSAAFRAGELAHQQDDEAEVDDLSPQAS
ncbi:tyrosine-type recombinase/integrase [Streptomyces canus]|uniref:tyrosine-type recombinase/integrase n=1 Tax=Streptomyces canus TaxID=58343 RepID=UPI0032468DAF